MKILINGFWGKMGQKIYFVSKNFADANVIFGVDTKEKIAENKEEIFDDIKILHDIFEAQKCDVVIDVSHKSALENVLDFCTKKEIPLVIATTGHSDEQVKKIKKASRKVAIFKSSNLSVGVWHFMNLITRATEKLKDFDIEIAEIHHNSKVDSPSGTAKTMFDAVKSVRKNATMVTGRNGSTKGRNFEDIGVHSIRGGGVSGEHSIYFLSQNEEIKISHRANGTDEFAKGAILASKFILAQKSGLFGMKNLLKGE